MVTSEQEEVLWVLDLVAEKEANRLDRLFPTVDVVTEEEVVRFRWEASILEDSKEIIILSMHIAYENQIINYLSRTRCDNTSAFYVVNNRVY